LISRPLEEFNIREHERLRKNIGAIRKYIQACMIIGSYYGDEPASETIRRPNRDFQLKFVIASQGDETEILKDFLPDLGPVTREDILLMPLGSSMEKMKKNAALTAEIAIRNGWRFAHRVQLDLFGDQEGT
jgi:7-carboxy-7-deazaguanine synthase